MRLFTGFVILALLSGCATSQKTISTPKPKDSVEEKKAPVVNTNKPSSDKANAQTPEKKENIPPLEVVKLKPEPPASLTGETLYYLLSAEVAGQRGEIAASAALYLKAAAITKDVRVAKRATRVAVYARENELALNAVNLWHSLEPENVEARQVLGALLIRAGQSEKAIEHLEYVLTHGKHTERQGYVLITSLLSKEKDKQSAINVMKKLIEKRQNNPEALFAYSQLALLVNELDEAAETINKVIDLKPGWTEAYILQSRIINQQGYKVYALETLHKAVNKQPENNDLRLYYARSLVDAKRFESASEQFAVLLENNPVHYEARYALGLLYLQMNKPLKAKQHFEALLEAKQKVSESRYYMGQLHETLNQLPEAIKWYSKVKKNEYIFDAKLRIAFIQSRQGDIEAAREILHNISPDNQDKELRLYLAEGEILNDAKMFIEAFDLYTDALHQLVDNTRLLYARALTAEKLDRIEIALRDLKLIVEREPGNAQALNAYGYTLIDKTERVEEGLALIQKAYKILPDDAAVMDSMGWAYYRLGEHEKALEYLERAFEKLKDAEIAAHLGEVLWVVGEQDKAREIWNATLQEFPQDDLLLNVMRKYSK